MRNELQTSDFPALVAQIRALAQEAEATAASPQIAPTLKAKHGIGIHDQLVWCADELEKDLRDAAPGVFDASYQYLSEMVIKWLEALVTTAQAAAVQGNDAGRAYWEGRTQAYQYLITYFMDLLSGKQVVCDLIFARSTGALPAAFAE